MERFDLKQTVENSVKNKIFGHGRGWCFTAGDFAGAGSDESIRQALSQLHKQKVIRRLAQGIYDYPKEHDVLGIIPPDLNQVAKAIAKKTPNNVFRFIPSNRGPVTTITEALTDGGDFAVAGRGEAAHCCFADPRLAPDGRAFVYPSFDRDDPEFKTVHLVWRELASGQETTLVPGWRIFDGYPMFSNDGLSLVWTRYEKPTGITSIAIADVSKAPASFAPIYVNIVGEGIRPLKLGDVAVSFWMIRWPDWFHGRDGKVLFPGVIKATDEQGRILPGLEAEILRQSSRTDTPLQ